MITINLTQGSFDDENQETFLVVHVLKIDAQEKQSGAKKVSNVLFSKRS